MNQCACPSAPPKLIRPIYAYQLLALSYSGIPVKELCYLCFWQISSKLNLILIVADYQYVRLICIRILIV